MPLATAIVIQGDHQSRREAEWHYHYHEHKEQYFPLPVLSGLSVYNLTTNPNQRYLMKDGTAYLITGI